MTPFLEKVGEKYGAFTLTKKLPIDELQMVLREVRHEPTGATIFHLENSDPENVFCLSFKTWPKSSDGVPHVLEHTALCGSKRFPIKDPFFSMNRRSLNTFMNAFTGSDFTCYPASSQIEKDFYNLLDVYLDAAFHPQLKKISFRQEGWRYEFAEADDPESALEYQGVVFNEMKGTFASPMTRLWDALMSKLYTKLPYSHNSGGRPQNIPDLTYDELIAFHDTYYHPGNCLFFFYGNLPLKNHLDFIEKKALKGVAKAPTLKSLPREERNTAPLSCEERYPVAENTDLEKKTMFAFAYLTVHISEQEEVLALALLDSILMDTDASLLKSTLLASKLCVSADAFLDPEVSEVPYVFLCKGCEGGTSEELLNVIEKRLREICVQKIPKELIEASLHQIEFGRTEIVGNSLPYGLTLFMRSALAMQHGCAPENALMIHSLFDTLRERLKDENYLPSLIEKHLLNNTHQVHLTLAPSHTLTKEEENQEKTALKKIKAQLTPEQKADIVKQARELKKYQIEMEKQNIECLPKVTLDDVPVTATDFPLIIEEFDGIKVHYHPTFTNQVLYADLIFDLPYISEEELPYVHLFTSLITEVGVRDRSYSENLKMIHAFTGGIDASCALHVQADNPTKMSPCLQLHGKALYRNAKHLFSLLKETATDLRLDEHQRIEELIEQIHTGLTSQLNSNSIRYAIQHSLSGFGPAPHITNQWYGLPYYKTIQKIAENPTQALPELINTFKKLKEKLLCLKDPHLILSCDPKMYEQLKKESFYGLCELPQNSFQPWNPNFAQKEVTSEGRLISSPVSFTAKAYPSITYLHPLSPALYVASCLLENKSLHRMIREQGGAYGSGAHFNSSIGAFYFHSFRDPNLYRTLEAFDEAVDTIAGGEFDDSDLEEAKLGMIQGLDSPIPPGGRAIVSYSRLREGKTQKIRQHFRDHLLTVTKKDVWSIIEKELVKKREKGITTSFAGPDFFAAEEKKLSKGQKPLPIHPI